MKKLFFLLGMVLFAVAACNKDKGSADDTADTLSGYLIDGLYDFVLSGDSVIQPLKISKTGTEQEKLNLSVSGLPAGVTADIGIPSGIPDFGSYIIFRVKGLPAAGVYPLKVILGNDAGLRRTYTINMTVPDASYTVLNLSDQVLYRGSNFSLPLQIRHVSGTKDELNLSFSGLPALAHVSFSSNNQVPDFSTTAFFDLRSAATGVYNLQLNAKAKTSGSVYSFPVQLTLVDSCFKALEGLYSNCTKRINGGAAESFSAPVSYSGQPNHLTVQMWPLLESVTFVVNCTDNTVLVPKAFYNGSASEHISGSGTYTAATKKIVLHCTVVKADGSTYTLDLELNP